jgi:hypothetical protein
MLNHNKSIKIQYLLNFKNAMSNDITQTVLGVIIFLSVTVVKFAHFFLHFYVLDILLILNIFLISNKIHFICVLNFNINLRFPGV